MKTLKAIAIMICGLIVCTAALSILIGCVEIAIYYAGHFSELITKALWSL